MTDPARSRVLPAPDHKRVVRTIRRTAVATAGGTLLAGGAALLVLPGPGLVIIIAGLAVLATEFAWAERRLHQARAAAKSAADKARRRGPAASSGPPAPRS